MKQWSCMTCDWVYDEAKGAPELGIAPGTPLEDLPDDWVCPECGSPKDYFDPVT